MNTAKAVLLTAVAVLGALSVSAPATGSSAKSHHVALRNISIKPDVLRIHRGESVTWTWFDKAIDSPHSVTSTGRLRFRSASVRFTGMYTVRFTKPGVYLYHCVIHPFAMHAKVIVR